MKDKILAIIPARKESKRLANKNISNLNGKPLIAYSIESALNCNEIDDVIVSTDCDEIMNISIDYGAKVPFLRPKDIALDDSSSSDVVMHALEFFENEKYTSFILLQPTSPLRTSQDISNAISLKTKNNASAVVSVCITDHSPLWSNTLPKCKKMNNFLSDDIRNKRSQDLPTYFRLNGAIYLQDVEYFKKHKDLIPKNDCYAYVMDKDKSIDIDDIIDFKIAEILLKIDER